MLLCFQAKNKIALCCWNCCFMSQNFLYTGPAHLPSSLVTPPLTSPRLPSFLCAFLSLVFCPSWPPPFSLLSSVVAYVMFSSRGLPYDVFPGSWLKFLRLLCDVRRLILKLIFRFWQMPRGWRQEGVRVPDWWGGGSGAQSLSVWSSSREARDH